MELKTIYIATATTRGDHFILCVTYDRQEAAEAIATDKQHLTPYELKHTEYCVFTEPAGIYANETAEEAYNRLLEEGEI